jgi:hypothetical protein
VLPYFCRIFSHDNEFDVEVDDFFFSELKMCLQVSLSDKLMSSPEILKYVKAAECYPNVSIAYQILLTVPVTGKLFEVKYNKKIKWLGYVHH